MSEKEIKTRSTLRIVSNLPTNSSVSSSTCSFTVRERIDNPKRQKREKYEKFMDCSFVLGSIAEVERCWSAARVKMQETRKRISPALMETLLFLKTNSSNWNQALV